MRATSIRGIPDDTYEQLRALAARNRRSINKEAVRAIENHTTDEPTAYQYVAAALGLILDTANIQTTGVPLDTIRANPDGTVTITWLHADSDTTARFRLTRQPDEGTL